MSFPVIYVQTGHGLRERNTKLYSFDNDLNDYQHSIGTFVFMQEYVFFLVLWADLCCACFHYYCCLCNCFEAEAYYNCTATRVNLFGGFHPLYLYAMKPNIPDVCFLDAKQ